MTYREMRNFTEMMRSLGYNRLISMENFRSPNFQLTAEILQWLVYRYDQNADVSQNIDTEQDRVIFIKMVAHFMMTKAHIKLNTKRLYQADGYAVRELLKVTTLLYNSMKYNRLKNETNEFNVHDLLDTNKLKEIKDTRQLASNIISKGATLSDLLKREVDLREARSIALSNQLEISEVERAIQQAIENVENEKQKDHIAVNNIASDEANLDLRIEKKRSELERNQKRLSTLQSVRPAYMDEYEQLEEELNHLYSAYLTSFRNQAYLESQYEDLVKQHLDRSDDKEMTLKKMADQLRKAESLVTAQYNGKTNNKKNKDDFDNLLDDDDDDEDESSEEDLNDIDLQENKPRPRGGPVGAVDMRNGDKPTLGSQRNFGTMRDEESNEDEDDDDDDDETDDETDDIDENSDESENQMDKKRMNGMNPLESSNMFANNAASIAGTAGYSRPRGAEYSNKTNKNRNRISSEPEDDF